MTNRKKRLKKGIDSLQEQIDFHEEKKKIAKELGQEELINYYDKELESLIKRKRDRANKL